MFVEWTEMTWIVTFILDVEEESGSVRDSELGNYSILYEPSELERGMMASRAFNHHNNTLRKSSLGSCGLTLSSLLFLLRLA